MVFAVVTVIITIQNAKSFLILVFMENNSMLQLIKRNGVKNQDTMELQ